MTLFPVAADQCLCSCLKDSLDAKAEDVFNLVILHPEDASKWGGNITYSCVSCSLINVSLLVPLIAEKLVLSIIAAIGAMASWLVRASSKRAVRVRTLTGGIVLCSWARQ